MRDPAWAARSAFERAAAAGADRGRHRLPPRRAGAHAHPRPGQTARHARRATTKSRSSSPTSAWRPPTRPGSKGSSCRRWIRDKRVLVYRVPRGVVGVITPWNWPYTMPGELIAPALGAGNTVVWKPGLEHLAVRCPARRMHRRGGSPARRLQPRHRPRLGRRRRDRRRSADGGRRLHRLDRGRPSRWRSERQARNCCSRWAATARSSCSTTPTSTPRSPPTLTACFLNAGQSCTPASGCWSTRPSTTTTWRAWSAAIGAEIHLGDPFDDGHHARSGEQRGERHQDGSPRARRGRAGRASSPAGGEPGGRPRCSTRRQSSTA